MLNPLSMRWAALAAAGVLATVGCQSTRTAAPARAEQPSATRGAERSEAEPTAEAPVAVIRPVYFEFDRWELDADARQILKANAQQIQARPDWGALRVEGHCDARGSDEYNMALGERRAGAVKRYLVDLGVPSTRVDTVSYGESRPAARGQDESAWRLNRRSEIHVEARQASR